LAYEQIRHFLDAPKSPASESRRPTDQRQPGEEENVHSAESANEQLNKGAACYNAGDNRGALDWFLKTANQGLAEAQYQAGLIYMYMEDSTCLTGGKITK
jgi:TPR repeat protein